MNLNSYVDVHVLQTVPPSNLNRDDAGSPKQAIYGGARRARVSSQAWKRATRLAFVAQVPTTTLATRTKKIVGLLANQLTEAAGLDATAATRVSAALLAPLGISRGKRSEETAYLLFFGRMQLRGLVEMVAPHAQELAAMNDGALEKAAGNFPIKDYLATGHPIDVALFGRMVADMADLNVDAATQVAHALSTHAVETEFDYFTAVDDENPRDETGAGMIGTVEFNSATLYRFATVGLHQLLENLGGDVEATAAALEVFLNAFVFSMPSGHETSFAHRTLPRLVSVVLRDDQPINLVSAFEAPVRGGEGLAAASAERLATEMLNTRIWGRTPAAVASTFTMPDETGVSEPMREAFGLPLPFPEVVATIVSAARERLNTKAA